MASLSTPPPSTDGADAVLTSLCSVCRAVPPRYKCPRCGTRSCSVVCSRRHRVRAGCSGIRDVTAYVPRSRLCTPAGIDHDFNFLRGIELARARTEKQIVEERHLLRPRELEKPRVLEAAAAADNDDAVQNKRPFSSKKQQQHQQRRHHHQQHSTLPPLIKEWHGDELRFVPARTTASAVTNALMSGNGGPSKRVQQLCQRGGIQWFGMPRGMVRQRENGTTVVPLPPRPGSSGVPSASAGASDGAGGGAGDVAGVGQGTEPSTAEPAARTKKGRGARPISDCCIAWQVEWLVYEDGPAGKPTRILRRHVDHEPLSRLYTSTMGWVLQKNGVTLADTEEDRVRRRAEAATAAADAAAAAATQGEEQEAGDELPSPPTEPGDDHGNNDNSSDSSVRFYLLRPRLPIVPAAGAADDERSPPPPAPRAKGPLPKELIPLEAHDTLATALRGRTVLEFPTIYALPVTPATAAAAATEEEKQTLLPAGHILGSTVRRVVDGGPAVEEEEDDDENEDDVAGIDSKDDKPPAAKKQKTERWSGIQEVDDSAAPALAPEEESETSSEGETEEDESEEDDEDDEDDEGLVEEEDEDVAAAETALPPLEGLTSGSVSAKGKAPLVVYESWSEGSGDEA